MGSNRYFMQTIICFHFQNNTTFFNKSRKHTFFTSRHTSSHLNYSFPHSKFHSFQFLLFKDNSPRCRKHKYFKVPLNLHVDIGHNTRISNCFIYETCLLWGGSGSLSNTMLRIIDFTGLTLKLLTQ